MPQAATGKPVVVAVLAVAILGMIGAVGYFVLASSKGLTPDYASQYPSGEPPYVSQPEPASPVAPANYRVSAKIGAQCEGVSFGSRWFLHEYRNTGEGPISFPKILARLRDAEGASIRDIETTSNVYILPAGESAWLLTTLPKEAASAAFIVDTPERVTQHTPAVSKLKLTEFTRTPHATIEGYTQLYGRVQNTHNRGLSSVLVQAIGFDAREQPCSYTLAYVDEKLVAPGASGTFSVLAGNWQVSVPARWEIHAWGMVEK
jgi:hypothetical protein